MREEPRIFPAETTTDLTRYSRIFDAIRAQEREFADDEPRTVPEIREWVARGEGLRLRKELGLRQADIAEEMGYSVSVVSEYETKRKVPSFAGAVAYHRALMKFRRARA